MISKHTNLLVNYQHSEGASTLSLVSMTHALKGCYSVLTCVYCYSSFP